jgi:hypothetical protein
MHPSVSLDFVSTKAQLDHQSSRQCNAFRLSIRSPAMSKAQKGNKESKKPKADKNQPRATISAYRTAQGQGKPASSPFARKKI